MNRRSLPAACLLAVLLASCSGSGSGTASRSPSASQISGPTYASAQASSALLVGSDLPAGYAKDPSYKHDSIPGGCGAVQTMLAAQSKRNPTFAVSSFRNSDDSISVDHEIEVYATPADAAAQFDELVSALTTCKSWPLGFGPGAATISLTPTELGVLGQRSTVLVLTVKAGKDEVRGDQVVVVSGNAIVTLADSASVGIKDPRVDLRRLATTLVQRLRAEVG